MERNGNRLLANQKTQDEERKHNCNAELPPEVRRWAGNSTARRSAALTTGQV